jgi:mRNA interferase RelE/StbE
MFSIEYSREAAKTMRSILRNVSNTIRGKIEQLAADPLSPNNNIKKLTGIPGYRLRMGDWRIIYEIYDDRLVILVIAVAPRGGVYK